MNIRTEYNKLDGVPTPKQAFLREIAEIALVSEATVQQWLAPSGARPGRKSLELLARHFGCTVEDLGLTTKDDEEHGR